MRWIIAALVCYVASAFIPGLGVIWPALGGGAYYLGLVLAYLVTPILALIGIVRIWKSRRSSRVR